MFCHKCGSKIPDEGRFCTSCGAACSPATGSNGNADVESLSLSLEPMPGAHPLTISISSAELTRYTMRSQSESCVEASVTAPKTANYSWFSMKLCVVGDDGRIIEIDKDEWDDVDSNVWEFRENSYPDSKAFGSNEKIHYVVMANAGEFHTSEQVSLEIPHTFRKAIPFSNFQFQDELEILSGAVMVETPDSDGDSRAVLNAVFRSLRDKLTTYELRVINQETGDQIGTEEFPLWGNQVYGFSTSFWKPSGATQFSLELRRKVPKASAFTTGPFNITLNDEPDEDDNWNSGGGRSETEYEGDLTKVTLATMRRDYDDSIHGAKIADDPYNSVEHFAWEGRSDEMEQFIVTVAKLEDKIRADVYSLQLGDTLYETFELSDGAESDYAPIRAFIVACLSGVSDDPDLQSAFEDDNYHKLSDNLTVLNDIAWVACYHSTVDFEDRDEYLKSRWTSAIGEDGELLVSHRDPIAGGIFVSAASATDTMLYQDADDDYETFETSDEFSDVRDESTRFVGVVI